MGGKDGICLRAVWGGKAGQQGGCLRRDGGAQGDGGLRRGHGGTQLGQGGGGDAGGKGLAKLADLGVLGGKTGRGGAVGGFGGVAPCGQLGMGAGGGFGAGQGGAQGAEGGQRIGGRFGQKRGQAGDKAVAVAGHTVDLAGQAGDGFVDLARATQGRQGIGQMRQRGALGQGGACLGLPLGGGGSAGALRGFCIGNAGGKGGGVLGMGLLCGLKRGQLRAAGLGSGKGKPVGGIKIMSGQIGQGRQCRVQGGGGLAGGGGKGFGLGKAGLRQRGKVAALRQTQRGCCIIAVQRLGKGIGGGGGQGGAVAGPQHIAGAALRAGHRVGDQIGGGQYRKTGRSAVSLVLRGGQGVAQAGKLLIRSGKGGRQIIGLPQGQGRCGQGGKADPAARKIAQAIGSGGAGLGQADLGGAVVLDHLCRAKAGQHLGHGGGDGNGGLGGLQFGGAGLQGGFGAALFGFSGGKRGFSGAQGGQCAVQPCQHGIGQHKAGGVVASRQSGSGQFGAHIGQGCSAFGDAGGQIGLGPLHPAQAGLQHVNVVGLGKDFGRERQVGKGRIGLGHRLCFAGKRGVKVKAGGHQLDQGFGVDVQCGGVMRDGGKVGLGGAQGGGDWVGGDQRGEFGQAAGMGVFGGAGGMFRRNRGFQRGLQAVIQAGRDVQALDVR